MQYKPQEEIGIEGDLQSLEEMMVQLMQDHWKQEEEIVTTKRAWREEEITAEWKRRRAATPLSDLNFV